MYGAHAHACAQSLWDLLIARASRCNFLWFPREERADNAVQVCPLVAVIPLVLSDADKGQPPPLPPATRDSQKISSQNTPPRRAM